MRLRFLGVGEACDSSHGNTSILFTSGAGTRLLLDCGFSVPHRFFSHCTDGEELDGLWISHFHGDHCFGAPLLLLRFWEMGRSRPLAIIGQEGTGERLLALLELAYPGFGKKLCFDLEHVVLEPGRPVHFQDLLLHGVETIHSQRNLGLRIDDGFHRIYYSGDGRASQEASRLMAGCDLLIHEAFQATDSVENHGSVAACLDLMEKSDARELALVHLAREFRQQVESGRLDLPASCRLPDDGELVVLGDQPTP